MKKNIHPTYYPHAKVTCACGHCFEVGSTQEKIEVEICSQCHPFYTGEEKVLDIAGRVEKFKTKRAHAAKEQEKMKEREAKKKEEKKKQKKEEKTKKGSKQLKLKKEKNKNKPIPAPRGGATG